MADIPPEEARHNRRKDAEATHESSGYSIEGDTPPAQGLGVGPTNHELDVEGPGDGAKAKFWLVLIAALIALTVVLLVVGRIVGM